MVKRAGPALTPHDSRWQQPAAISTLHPALPTAPAQRQALQPLRCAPGSGSVTCSPRSKVCGRKRSLPKACQHLTTCAMGDALSPNVWNSPFAKVKNLSWEYGFNCTVLWKPY